MNAKNAFLGGGGIFFQEVAGQQFHVFPAFSQRRNRNGYHAHAVIEVFAEGTGGHHFFQIFIGGGNHAHINGGFLGPSHRTDAALLQDAQQLHLHGNAHLADFIEKDGPAVRHFKKTALVLCSPGECPLHVAEQFAFQQSLRKGAAIDGDKRF